MSNLFFAFIISGILFVTFSSFKPFWPKREYTDNVDAISHTADLVSRASSPAQIIFISTLYASLDSFPRNFTLIESGFSS
jgi:hypothetical protein